MSDFKLANGTEITFDLSKMSYGEWNGLFDVKESRKKSDITLARVCNITVKELEDVHIDNVINDIQTETDIIYMLGLAEEQYYDEAKKLVEEGKIDKNDLIFRGLMAHLSIKEKIPKSKKV